ncbi:MAG: hypothetical protein CL912_12240 [Deltaproteobacteria bacterium]|nr:hypothetical protein [Deltaproteobacteria bacterium]
MVVEIWFGTDLLERHLEGSVPGSGPIHDRHFSFGWFTIGENWDESVMLYHADKALFGAWDLDLDGIAQSATYHSHFPIADCGLRIANMHSAASGSVFQEINRLKRWRRRGCR